MPRRAILRSSGGGGHQFGCSSGRDHGIPSRSGRTGARHRCGDGQRRRPIAGAQSQGEGTQRSQGVVEVTSPERGDEQQQGCAHSQGANRHEECLRARWLVQFVRHQQGTRDCLRRSRPLGRQRQLSSQAARAKGGRLIILASVGRGGYTSIGLFSQVWLRFCFAVHNKRCSAICRRATRIRSCGGREVRGISPRRTARARTQDGALRPRWRGARARQLLQPKRQWNRPAPGARHDALIGVREVCVQRAGFACKRQGRSQPRREG